MTKKDLKNLKEKLEKEKKEILEELKKHKTMPDFGDDVDSLEEEADESTEFSNELSIIQACKNRLSDIETALKKIMNGKYGICEKCKKEISLKLLEIDPESRLCRECKKIKQRT